MAAIAEADAMLREAVLWGVEREASVADPRKGTAPYPDKQTALPTGFVHLGDDLEPIDTRTDAIRSALPGVAQ
jgi:hypothetical protein